MITNLLAVAYEDECFIHYNATYTDHVCSAGLEEMLMHKVYTTGGPTSGTATKLRYNIFMGDFYMSALLFKHSILEEIPLVPLIHKREFQREKNEQI